MPKINFLGCHQESLENFFVAIGEKKFRASQLISWIHQRGVDDFESITSFSKDLKKHLAICGEIKAPTIVKDLVSSDGTRKWMLKLVDGFLIETVFIPEGKRGTLCVSSQVGCALNCSFCATGSLGFKRNLETFEIIGQLWLAKKILLTDQAEITNLVFMGMGEPLLNLDPVLETISLALSDYAYGLSKYRVTLSTAGIIPQLKRLKSANCEVALAISLHAPTDELRNQLMPINLTYPVVDLIKVINNYFGDSKRPVTIEYLLLAGINDQLSHAKQLAKLLAGGNYKVNLIPVNTTRMNIFCAPQQSVVDDFRQVLLDAKIMTITRKTRGDDIKAACGQLVGEE